MCNSCILILQAFRYFTYVITHSLTLPSLYLRHSSFPNPSVASFTSQFILQPFFRFSYVTGSSINSPALLILQPVSHFTYVTAHCPTLPSLYLRHSSFPTLPLLHLRHTSFSNPFSLLLRHSLFTYATWRAAHGLCSLISCQRLYNGMGV